MISSFLLARSLVVSSERPCGERVGVSTTECAIVHLLTAGIGSKIYHLPVGISESIYLPAVRSPPPPSIVAPLYLYINKLEI